MQDVLTYKHKFLFLSLLLLLLLLLLFWFFETGSPCEVQSGLELSILILSLPRAGITGVHHHVWLFLVLNLSDFL
jgi:hypothetical protein